MSEPSGYVAQRTEGPESRKRAIFSWFGLLIVLALAVAISWEPARGMYHNWRFRDSYYSHGCLVPVISIVLAWRKRDALKAAPLEPSRWGYVFLFGACGILLVGDFLGFRVFGQFAIIPMLVGLLLLFAGKQHALILWFPLAFLLFMVPLPPSMVQSLVFRTKLVATEAAVWTAFALHYPMISDGSFVHFGNDKLLIGEVCGGLRSLIALLAFGALMSYLSKTRLWAKLVLFAVSGPVALAANTLRILFLCVVAYHWGSESATGLVHDISGIMIFAVAFVFLFAIEGLLRRIAPARDRAKAEE